MKKLVVVIALLSVIGFVAWKKAQPHSFTVKTRKGQTIQVTGISYEPSRGLDSLSWDKDFTLYLDFGSFKVRKDLQDIKRIEVLDGDGLGLNLKVTDAFGETIEGKRNEGSREYVSDWIRGDSGKIRVFLSLNQSA